MCKYSCICFSKSFRAQSTFTKRTQLWRKQWELMGMRDFPGGPMVKNLPSNTGETGSMPGWGTKFPCSSEQLSPCTTTSESVCCKERSPMRQLRRNAAKEINDSLKRTDRCEMTLEVMNWEVRVFPYSNLKVGSVQHSCLENPRDGEAWWAAVCGLSQSWTQLKRLSNSSVLSQAETWECSCRLSYHNDYQNKLTGWIQMGKQSCVGKRSEGWDQKEIISVWRQVQTGATRRSRF